MDPALVGRRIELRYRPEDLMSVEVWWEGEQRGWLEPLLIGRHVHPMAPPPVRPPVEPTGIDYLGQVLADQEAQTTGSIAFPDLVAGTGDEEPFR